MPGPEYDAVVIGSGAGGGVVASSLANAGLSVLVLERGRWFDYESDFTTRRPDWELRSSVLQTGSVMSDPTIEFSNGAAIAAQDADLCSRLSLDRDGYCPQRAVFSYSRVHGVGGTTLHYQGEAHRFPGHAFQPASRFGAGVDWPIDYVELEPYYARVEQMLGVAGEPGNPFKPARGTFPTPAHPLSTKSQWVRQGAQRLGWSLLPNTLALPSRSYDGRTPCQRSGACVRGCPFGAKSSVDRALLQPALSGGRLRVLDNAQATRLECENNGNIAAVVYHRDGQQHRVSANKYLLAGGAIESPRLLLASQCGRYPNGIGNDHDRVGRNLMETIYVILTVEADVPLNAYQGPPIDARIWDFNHPGSDARNGFVLGVSGTMGEYNGPHSYLQKIPGFGRRHKNAMRANFGRMVNLFGIADHTPHPDNRLLLGDELDEAGVPKVRVISDFHVRDRDTLREMIGRLSQLADACQPARIMDLYSTYSNPGSTHMAGTCMMGSDPEQSVTDRYGRVHGVDNLYITDASILPGQGMGDSPSLTVQALALRTAEYIVRNTVA